MNELERKRIRYIAYALVLLVLSGAIYTAIYFISPPYKYKSDLIKRLDRAILEASDTAEDKTELHYYYVNNNEGLKIIRDEIERRRPVAYKVFTIRPFAFHYSTFDLKIIAIPSIDEKIKVLGSYLLDSNEKYVFIPEKGNTSYPIDEYLYSMDLQRSK